LLWSQLTTFSGTILSTTRFGALASAPGWTGDALAWASARAANAALTLVLGDLTAPPDHHAPQLAVLVAGLDHQRHLGVAADVDDLLRLAVRGHVEGAVSREVVHGHDMREAVLVDGGRGGFLAFPEERGLLVGAQPDLLPSVGRHSWHAALSATASNIG
jgi:hypothetical protein